MDDNARPHRVHVTDAYLEHETIVHMDWPAWPLNLNPIEHVWDILQRGISARPVQPRTLQELKDALVADRRLIPQNRIQILVTSMRRRCRAVIDARGHHTRYQASFNNNSKAMWNFRLLESPVLRQILGVPKRSL